MSSKPPQSMRVSSVGSRSSPAWEGMRRDSKPGHGMGKPPGLAGTSTSLSPPYLLWLGQDRDPRTPLQSPWAPCPPLGGSLKPQWIWADMALPPPLHSCCPQK